MKSRQERVHVLTGAVCNNNCLFCMEEDRDARYETNSQTDDSTVRWILENKAGAEEICFTSGEPTLNRRLPVWASWAKGAGIANISVMTNARMLSQRRYAQMLVKSGINRFYVSIHGHESRLHDSLVRTPGAFEQTTNGIRNIASLKRFGLQLHTSTVVTKRNLPHLASIYVFLRDLGVDQVVFNVMQANGRANTHFEKIFPRYTEIAKEAAVFLNAFPDAMAFFVDIPLCTTEGLPDFNRGFVESYTHFESVSGGHDIALLTEIDPQSQCGPDSDLVQLRRSDLDDALRKKRAECAECKYDSVCEGVWSNYLSRHGWEEFVPVPV
ncbi:MAG: radical SAM protein HxsC4 [Myxococcota bacterium]